MSQTQPVTVKSTAVQILSPSEFKIELSRAKSELATLIEDHKDLNLDVTVPLNYSLVENAWRQYRLPRIELEKKVDGTVKDLKSQVKAFQEEGDAIVSSWKAEEDKLKAPLAAEDARKAAEKAAKVAAETQRIAKGNALIKDISLIPSQYAAASSIDIEAAIAELSAKELKEDELLEFFDDAVSALNTSLDTLNTLLESKKQAEVAAAELATQRAAFLAEQEAARAKQAEIDLANKQVADARQAAIDAENAKVAQEAAAKQAVIDAANAATAKALADQQAEIARQAKELQDKQDEVARIEQAKADAKALKIKEAEAENLRLAAEQKALEESEAHKAWLAALTPQSAFEYILERSQDAGIQEVCRAMLAK